MYEIAKHAKDIPWSALDIEGVEIKVIHEDKTTGALTVLTRMNEGACIPKHFHSEADETVYVLEGEFIEIEKAYGPGSIFFGSATTSHGPHKTNSGCMLLTHFTSALDFNIEE